MSEPYHPFRTEPDYYAERADGLRSVHDAGLDSARAIVAELLPGHSGPLGEDDARLVLARQHGAEDWAGLLARVATLDGDPFRQAYLAVEDDDAAALAAVLAREPWLVRARGTNGNDLLGMAGSLEVMRLLLERGADPARANDKGWTPLHQAAYGNRVGAARLLLEAGAPVDRSGHGEGGTPLVAALFWGHREVAEVLAEHGTPPGNLRVAAGLGRLEEIAALAPGGGRVTGGGARRARLLPPALGLPSVAAHRCGAGGARRGARVGGPQRPGGGAVAARGARRGGGRRRLPRHGPVLGGGLRPRGGDRAPGRARRRRRPPRHVRRPRPR